MTQWAHVVTQDLCDRQHRADLAVRRSRGGRRDGLLQRLFLLNLPILLDDKSGGENRIFQIGYCIRAKFIPEEGKDTFFFVIGNENTLPAAQENDTGTQNIPNAFQRQAID